MEQNEYWNKFIRSGKISDYINYVNSCKENGILERNDNTFYDSGPNNKGTEYGRK